MNGVLGKIMGWLQFGLVAAGQVTQGGAPHGWAGWLTTIASLAVAVGTHAASNVGQAVDPNHSITNTIKQ